MNFDSQNTPEETREDPYLSYEHRKQIEGITLWPHAEVKALYSQMRNTRSWKELNRLIRKLGYFLKIGAVTDLEPDSDLEEIFTSLPIKRRMEILRRELGV